MARQLYTGLIWQNGALEWTSLQRVKEHFKVVASARTVLAETEPSEEGAAPAEPAKADKGAVASSSDRLRAETSQLKGDVSVGLASEDLLLRVVTLPAAAEEELQGMVQLQIDKFSPFPVESLVVAHEVLRADDDQALVLIAGIKKVNVESLGTVLVNAGIRPVRADAVILAWYRLLQDAGETGDAEGRRIVIFMDATSAELMLLDKQVPILCRSLGTREGLSEQEFADEVTREVSHSLMSAELEHGSVDADAVIWQADTDAGPVREALAGLCSDSVGVKSVADLSPVTEGLARRMTRPAGKLDLTPAAWRSAFQARQLKRRLVLAVASLAAIWLGGAAVIWGGVALQRVRLRALEARQEEWSAPAMAVRAMRRRVSVIKPYTDRTHSALECLRELSARQPPGIDLQSFSYRKGEAVRIVGEANDSKQIYEFKDELDKAGLFPSVTLGSQNLIKNKWRFDVDIALPGEEE